MLLAMAAPLLLATLLAAYLCLGRPLIFRQMRPGLGQRPFVLLQNTHAVSGCGPSSLDRSPASSNTSRRVAAALERAQGRHGADRAPPAAAVDLPAEPELLRLRATVRPGVTGWAQVNGGLLLTAEQKLALDLWYIRHRSLSLDLVILLRTIAMIARGGQIDHRALQLALGPTSHPPGNEAALAQRPATAAA